MKKVKRESLEKLKKPELTKQAKTLGHKDIAHLEKSGLIDLIQKSLENEDIPVSTEPSVERKTSARTEVIVEEESPKNDIAIQHPSASP